MTAPAAGSVGSVFAAMRNRDPKVTPNMSSSLDAAGGGGGVGVTTTGSDPPPPLQAERPVAAATRAQEESRKRLMELGPSYWCGTPVRGELVSGGFR